MFCMTAGAMMCSSGRFQNERYDISVNVNCAFYLYIYINYTRCATIGMAMVYIAVAGEKKC